MYIPSSPSSSSVGLLRRSVQSMVLGVGGGGGHFMVICMVPFFHFYQWPLSRGLEPTLEPPTGGTILIFIFIFIFICIIFLGPLPLYLFSPPFGFG